MKPQPEKKPPSFGVSLFIMIVVFAVIMIPTLLWGSKVNALFLIAWLVAIILCTRIGVSYKEIQAGIVASCLKAIVPIMIILCVGGLVGTWMAAGTVPLIISFGVKMISPGAFLVTAFLLCAVSSVVTGTSWGTFGTAGLALAGIGLSLNVDPVITAGAVCSGAFFGDTISPMSDSPNMASGVSGVDLFKGIRHQAKVTVPSAIICGVIFWVLGMRYRGGHVDMEAINEIVTTIDMHYKTGFVTMLPVVFVVLLLVIKVPSIPAILSGGIFGGVIACLYQGVPVNDCITYFWSGYSIDTGMAFIDTLLNRGGIISMASTALMFLFAFGLFGILNAANVVDVVVTPLTKYLHSKLSLIVSTVLLSVLGTVLSAAMNFSYAFVGNIMGPVYEKRGLQKVNMMRALCIGCTAMTCIVPWSLSSGVASEFLGVTALQLIPYNLFLYISPLVLILWTIFGNDTKWVDQLSEEERQEELESYQQT